MGRNLLNMIWANESGVSVYFYKSEHGHRMIEIHQINSDGYEEIAATATIEKHNRGRVVECFTDTKEERMEKFKERFNISDNDMKDLAKAGPIIKSEKVEPPQ